MRLLLCYYPHASFSLAASALLKTNKTQCKQRQKRYPCLPSCNKSTLPPFNIWMCEIVLEDFLSYERTDNEEYTCCQKTRIFLKNCRKNKEFLKETHLAFENIERKDEEKGTFVHWLSLQNDSYGILRQEVAMNQIEKLIEKLFTVCMCMCEIHIANQTLSAWCKPNDFWLNDRS